MPSDGPNTGCSSLLPADWLQHICWRSGWLPGPEKLNRLFHFFLWVWPHLWNISIVPSTGISLNGVVMATVITRCRKQWPFTVWRVGWVSHGATRSSAGVATWNSEPSFAVKYVTTTITTYLTLSFESHGHVDTWEKDLAASGTLPMIWKHPIGGSA